MVKVKGRRELYDVYVGMRACVWQCVRLTG